MKYRAWAGGGPDRVIPKKFISRASPATYNDGDGILQTAGIDVARYQGGQLLAEGEATNHLLYSQAINNAAWSGCTVTTAAEMYRGTVPFWTVAKATSVTSESRGQNAKNVLANEYGTVTLAILAGSSDRCSLGILHNNPTGWGTDLDSTAQVLEGPGIITARGGSLCTLTGLSPTEPTLIRITRRFVADGTSTVRVYPGIHSSSTIGQSVKFTRVQYEQGSEYSSYISTTTVKVTRAADICEAEQILPQVEGDYQFGQGSHFLIDSPEAVAQAISSRLRLLAGEWFLDDREGLKTNDILGYNTQTTRDYEIKTRVANTKGVKSILSYSSTVDPSRRFVVEVQVETQYGPVTIKEIM